MAGRPSDSLRRAQSKPALLRIASLGGLAAFGALVGAILGMVTAAVFGVLLGLGLGMLETRLFPTTTAGPQLADDPLLMGAAFLGLAGGLLGAASGAVSGAVTLATGRVQLGCAAAVLSAAPVCLALPSDPKLSIAIASIMAAGGIMTAIGLRIAAIVAERIWPQAPRGTTPMPSSTPTTPRDRAAQQLADADPAGGRICEAGSPAEMCENGTRDA